MWKYCTIARRLTRDAVLRLAPQCPSAVADHNRVVCFLFRGLGDVGGNRCAGPDFAGGGPGPTLRMDHSLEQ